MLYNPPVKILSINLASHQGHIAICSETAVLAWNDADHRLADNEVTPLIEQTLKTAGLAYPDLTHMACVVGPGGFTSIRSGVTIANVMSHELKIPLAGIHLSDLYFNRISAEVRVPPLQGNIWWLHSTKKEQLFVRGASVTEPTLMGIAELLVLLKKGDEWMGELIESQESAVKDLGVSPAELKPIQEVLPSFLAKQSYSAALLEPWYGRGW